MTLSPAIVVHGGAGSIPEQDLQGCNEGCRAAAEAGWAALARGECAVDAAQAAVMAMEDDPRFNAGRGSVLNRDGTVETDAAIMDGATLNCGAVGAVSGIRNPIQLARSVMRHGRHVLLAGAGAAQFAREAGDITLCDPRDLITPESLTRWQHACDTVGCVALDRNGRLAAATSTGGLFRKLPGRVGDSPLIGCGTYADDRVAVSCTGDGEDIIRTVLAHRTAVIAQQGQDAQAASDQSLAYLARHTRGQAGLIAVDRDGTVGWALHAPQMPVCAITPRGMREGQ